MRGCDLTVWWFRVGGSAGLIAFGRVVGKAWEYFLGPF